jgi:hypothetical protein
MPIGRFALRKSIGRLDTPSGRGPIPHNELLIHASCSIVWQHLVRAQTWPEWYPNSHNMKLLNSPDGRLHQDTQF